MGKYSSNSDHELIQSLKKHDDKDAFEELYNRYWDKLLVQALMKLNSEMEAEEVVQDVFLNLWRRRKNIDIKFTFKTYIAFSVKYEIFSRLARRQKEKNYKGETIRFATEENNTTEESIYYEILRKEIEDTVSRLPEKCQLVFRLSREKGYSQKEIAEELNISPKTVETHITKALKAIRSSLRSIIIQF